MRSKKPIIGITLGQGDEVKNYRWPTRYAFDYLGKAYHYAIEKSGGSPIGLFSTNDKDTIAAYLMLVDGLLFTGGIDINPRYFGQAPDPSSAKPVEPRDSFELRLIKAALQLKKPIFCICRGHQLLNVARGGTLFQDLGLRAESSLEHADPEQTGGVAHDVVLQKKSLLYKVIGKTRIKCNSSHHQCIDKPGRGLVVTATSSDGIIEGLELGAYPFLLSVQWHPERIFTRGHSRKLFEAFVKAAGR